MIQRTSFTSAACRAALVAAALGCAGCGEKPAPPKSPTAADKLDPTAAPKDKVDAAREAAEKYGAPPKSDPKTSP